MLTVTSNTRNVSLYIIAAVAITFLGLLIRPGMPAITVARQPLIPDTGGQQSAQELFRSEELALYDRPAASSIGSPSFYEYRRGEWTSGPLDVTGEFRQEELLLYKRQAASSIGSPAFYDYRRGEWFGK
jgi:hypothetical protein